MMRFLRRVFILLVLFCIIFLAFRFIKPDATRNFVSKVKAIPQTISSRFHRESKVTINSNTVSLTGDILNLNKDKQDDGENAGDNNLSNNTENKNDSYDDLQRLQELNAEIEAILQSGKNVAITGNTENNVEIATESSEPSTGEDIVVTEIKPEVVATGSTTTQTNSNSNNTTSNNTTTTNNNTKNNKGGLSQQDYNEAAQIMNMFE